MTRVRPFALSAIHVEAGILVSAGSCFAKIFGDLPQSAVLVTDEKVEPLYADRLHSSIGSAGWTVATMTVPVGETSKSLDQAGRLYEALAEIRFPRDGVVVALGGGVVCDLAGFVAATWMRGVDLALCPTTLEADIDAAIGGKTAVNLGAGKNLVGAFHPARLVLIDPTCLRTLDLRDVRAGLAESIKHALIASEEFLSWHESRLDDVMSLRDAALTELIERNVAIKSAIVSRDPFETTGERMFLNFGHTIGHAIENACGYSLRHGECVGLGMLAACRLSEQVAGLPSEVTRRVEALLQRVGLPTRLPEPIPVETILEAIGRDKKARAGGIRFVLLEGVARPVIRTEVGREDVVAVYRALV